MKTWSWICSELILDVVFTITEKTGLPISFQIVKVVPQQSVQLLR